MAMQHPGLKRIRDYWHFSLKLNGQRVHGSTRAKDLPTAKRVLEKHRRELLMKQCGAAPVTPVGTISYMPAIVGLKVAEEVLRMLLATEPVP